MDKSIKKFIVKNESKILNFMFFEIGIILTLISLILLGLINNEIIPSII
tara:strand:- start:838 stop:984 length:147 start_codon:yes stop_codon:yes gene_type:complete